MDYSNYEIVCVDDDLEVLETTMALVEHVGVPSVGISNARKAAEYISKNKDKILMVLSDLRMDDVNGFEFKKMIQPFA